MSQRTIYPKDLTGLVFGGLVVTGPDGVDKRGNTKWRCLCGCGRTKTTSRPCLVNGLTKSCGCLRKAAAKKVYQSTLHKHFSRKKIPANKLRFHDTLDDALDDLEALL